MLSDPAAAQKNARSFVAGVDLSEQPQQRPRALDDPAPSFVPDAAKDQAVIVGSGILCYVKGLGAQHRRAVNDSSLLAQLVATKLVPDSSELGAWYDAFFNVLTSVGWLFQERGFSRYDASSDDADVHEAILSIAAGLLGGPATTAYEVVKVTLDTLKSLSEASPWLTLFARESEHAQAARFQMTVVDRDGDGFVASLMAFELRASALLTQVLFFKYKSEQATLQQYSGKVSIEDAVLSSVASDIAAKIASFTAGYVKTLPDLDHSAST